MMYDKVQSRLSLKCTRRERLRINGGALIFRRIGTQAVALHVQANSGTVDSWVWCGQKARALGGGHLQPSPWTSRFAMADASFQCELETLIWRRQKHHLSARDSRDKEKTNHG